jgi:hypothetical protein
VLVTIGFSLVGVLGDYFLKVASERAQPLRTGAFCLGFALSLNRFEVAGIVLAVAALVLPMRFA